MEEKMEKILKRIKEIKKNEDVKQKERKRWKMIIIRRKKGWKGKKKVEGMVVEKYWRENEVKVEN